MNVVAWHRVLGEMLSVRAETDLLAWKLPSPWSFISGLVMGEAEVKSWHFRN